MSDYPTLQEMGIARFNEISHYVLRQEGPERDVLKIYYQREKGSFLPHSRKYKFGRATNTMRTGGGTSGAEEVHEVSPFLQKAVAELDSLVASHDANIDSKAKLLAEIAHLESVVQIKCAELKKQVEQLK